MIRYATAIPKLAKNGKTVYGGDGVVHTMDKNNNLTESYDFIKEKIIKATFAFRADYKESHNPPPMYSVQSWDGRTQYKTFNSKIKAIIWKTKGIEFIHNKIIQDFEKNLLNMKRVRSRMRKSTDKIREENPEYFI